MRMITGMNRPQASASQAAMTMYSLRQALRPTRAWSRTLLIVLIVCIAGCSQQSRCEAGLCPVGTQCDQNTGWCVDADADAPTVPLLMGAYSAVALPGLSRGYLGYAAREKSLVWIEQTGLQTTTQFIAGPAAGDGADPQGKISHATATSNGEVHIAWISDGGQTLWYGHRVDGRWTRKRIDAVPPKRAARTVAIALGQGRPLVAFEDELTDGVSVAVMSADGTFEVENVPLPGGPAVKLKGELSFVGGAAGGTLGMYDAASGDLLLASRSSSGWKTARFAGHEPDVYSDAGLPVRLGRDLSGSLLVVWRDRSANEVRVARSVGGKVQRSVVSDGLYSVPNRQLTRRNVVGTALSIAVQPTGRVAVGVQDASQARVFVALERPNGTFKTLNMPASGRAQYRPQVLQQVDGSLLVSWLELEPQGSGEGRLTTWALSQPRSEP